MITSTTRAATIQPATPHKLRSPHKLVQGSLVPLGNQAEEPGVAEVGQLLHNNTVARRTVIGSIRTRLLLKLGRHEAGKGPGAAPDRVVPRPGWRLPQVAVALHGCTTCAMRKESG
jgi:hypothetical protein